MFSCKELEGDIELEDLNKCQTGNNYFRFLKRRVGRHISNCSLNDHWSKT